MDKGFIKLNRKFFSHKMWEAARTFSECEAWIDLLQSARFEATEQIERIGGREIKVGRGQYPASNRYLANKWSWGDHKVRGFLGRLKTEKMIQIDTSQGINIITLCKYDYYNSQNPANISPDDSPIDLLFKELDEVKTQLSAQQMTWCPPTDRTNLKKEKKEEELNTSSPYNPPKVFRKFNFEFVERPFFDNLIDWLLYKAEKKQAYRTQRSIELCYEKIMEKSGGDPLIAKKIVEQSMANNWNSLFELKEQKYTNNHEAKRGNETSTDYTIGM